MVLVLVLVLEGRVLVDMSQVLYFFFITFKTCLVIDSNARNSLENCGKISMDKGNIAVKSLLAGNSLT